MVKLNVGSKCSIGRLLQEDSVASNFCNINRNRQPLTGEDGVHDWNILVGEIARNGEDKDAR